jgi:hypothetical protein
LLLARGGSIWTDAYPAVIVKDFSGKTSGFPGGQQEIKDINGSADSIRLIWKLSEVICEVAMTGPIVSYPDIP